MKPLALVPLPLAPVTTTVTAPASCAGVVAVIVVAFTTVMFDAALPSNATVAFAPKPVPWIVTLVPPAVEPLSGPMLATVGGVAVGVGVLVAVAVGFAVAVAVAVGAAVGVSVGSGRGVAVGGTGDAVGDGGAVGSCVPETGVTAGAGVGVGVLGATKVYPLGTVTICPSGLATTTSTAPALCAGVFTVMPVAPVTVTWGASTPSNFTVAPFWMLLPAIVVVALAADPAWRAQFLAPNQVGTADANARLVMARWIIWAVFLAMVSLVLGARWLRGARERQRGLVRISYVDGRTISVPQGLSVLDASKLYRVPHQNVCGGRGRCTTCRIRVFHQPTDLPPPEPLETAALRRVGAEPEVRLACQLYPLSDIRLALLLPPGETKRRRPMRGGEERYLVIMFVDLRGSTTLAEQRLPFDTVFVVNSFLAAVGRAVSAAGGQSNQMLGDGLLGLFGLNSDPATAARQALDAAAGIARNVQELNIRLAADLQAPLRYGIGINGGQVIVGDIGYEDFMVFTALGDPVNVAARLEGMTKEKECALLVMDDVARAAGAGSEWPVHIVLPRGRTEELVVRGATEADLLAYTKASRPPLGSDRPAPASVVVR